MDFSAFCFGQYSVSQGIKVQANYKRLNRKLNQLYDTILERQNGSGDQERIALGDGNEDFLTWAIYYRYDGQCVVEDERYVETPYEFRETLAESINTRKKLIEAVDQLYIYRVDQGLDKWYTPVEEMNPIKECSRYDEYMRAWNRFSLQNVSERELNAKTSLLESIA